MKAWGKVHFYNKKSPKGFLLECLTAELHNSKASEWLEAVRDLFQNVCNRYPLPDHLIDIPKFKDISNANPFQSPISKSIDEARGIFTRFHQHLALIKQAIEEAKSDLKKAATTLQRVFGQDPDQICFPLPEDLPNGENSSGKKASSPFAPKRDISESPPFA